MSDKKRADSGQSSETMVDISDRISDFRQALAEARTLLPPSASIYSTHNTAIVSICLAKLRSAEEEGRLSTRDHIVLSGEVHGLLDGFDQLLRQFNEATKPQERWAYFAEIENLAAGALPVVDLIGQVVEPSMDLREWRTGLVLDAYHEALTAQATRVHAQVGRVDRALRQLWRWQEEFIEQNRQQGQPAPLEWRPAEQTSIPDSATRPMLDSTAARPATAPKQLKRGKLDRMYLEVEEKERTTGIRLRHAAVVLGGMSMVALLVSVLVGVLPNTLASGSGVSILLSIGSPLFVAYVAVVGISGGLAVYLRQESRWHLEEARQARAARLEAAQYRYQTAELPSPRRDEVRAHVLRKRLSVSPPRQSSPPGPGLPG